MRFVCALPVNWVAKHLGLSAEEVEGDMAQSGDRGGHSGGTRGQAQAVKAPQ